jgi:hypothetical protein
MIRITRQILLGRQNQEWYDAGMQHASEQRDVHTEFRWGNLKEADTEDLDAHEWINTKMDLTEVR